MIYPYNNELPLLTRFATLNQSLMTSGGLSPLLVMGGVPPMDPPFAYENIGILAKVCKNLSKMHGF